MTVRRQYDREAFLGRVRERSSGLVTEINTILLGGVLSAAGFGMIEIVRHPTDWPMRVMLWLVGMVACFIAYFRLSKRAPFYVSSGAAVYIAMPALGVCEVLLFAALTLDGPGDWRFWFAPAVAVAATGALTNALELRRLRSHHYAVDATAVFDHLRASLRAEAAESLGLIVLNGGIGAAVWALPSTWPYFPLAIGVYLALSPALALLIVPREAREVDALIEALHATSLDEAGSDSSTNIG